jgi:hypothetical protein
VILRGRLAILGVHGIHVEWLDRIVECVGGFVEWRPAFPVRQDPPGFVKSDETS